MNGLGLCVLRTEAGCATTPIYDLLLSTLVITRQMFMLQGFECGQTPDTLGIRR